MRGYRADTAFDGERRLTGGVLVLVEDSSIVGIEPGLSAAPAGCEVTHFPGTTLLPGLIDTHVHLCGDSSPRALDRLPGLSPSELDDAIEAAKRRTLAVGVTSVRDLGDQEWAVVDRHRGAGDGPTVVASGPPITSLRGHCWSMGGEAAGTAALRQAVRDRSDRGADIVKIMASGGVLTPGTDVLACQFSVEELRAVVEEAHDVGLGVTAHAHGLPAVEQCVAAEVDGIEHCSCLVTGGFRTPPELAAALAAAGIAVCPTLGVASGVEPPPQLKALMEATGATVEGRRGHFGKLYRAGVTLISGGDSGISPGKPHGILPNAVADLTDCGVPTADALTSATSLAAWACGLGERTGRLRAGLDADLLIVDGDPLLDIAALTRVRKVVSRGRDVDIA
ncbi:MAG: amidohydrolase family protein [Geodermatophilaceae bacterium]|nr:amidohydrolase family protein [Geodermatophilaceae bacterium]